VGLRNAKFIPSSERAGHALRSSASEYLGPNSHFLLDFCNFISKEVAMTPSTHTMFPISLFGRRRLLITD
jgi:hypothetical protein